jgi:effector-binding domain-containing protein
VAAICGTIDHGDVLAWYSDAMTELDSVLASAKQSPTGPPGGLHDQKLFTDDHGDVVVYSRTNAHPAIGRVQPFTIPTAELAVTVHVGPHDDMDITYGPLSRYVTDQALAISGPVHAPALVT